MAVLQETKGEGMKRQKKREGGLTISVELLINYVFKQFLLCRSCDRNYMYFVLFFLFSDMLSIDIVIDKTD